MYWLLLLMPIASAANSFISRHRSLLPDLRIVNGDVIDISEAPYQASLQTPKEGHFCSASILSTRFLLTAADCVQGKDEGLLDGIFVRVGTSKHATGGVDIIIHKIHVYKNYYMGDDPKIDLALLELVADLHFSHIIQPVNLPEKGDILPEDTMLEVSGWGIYTYELELSKDLRRLPVSVVSNENCKELYNNTIITITDDMMCAGSKKVGSGVCIGDDGDPLVRNNTLYGVVFWEGECYAETHNPTVYTKVESALDWIKDVMKMQ